MILAWGNTGVREEPKYSQYRWDAGDTSVYYCVNDDEYFYEDDRFIVLLDTIIDKSRHDLFVGEVNKLIDDYDNGRLFQGLFLGTYFVIVVDKVNKNIALLRDPSGVKTGYYSVNDGLLCVGNSVHEVARESGVKEFDEKTVYQLLYLDYTFDGYTYYQDVHEVKIGQTLKINSDSTIIEEKKTGIVFSDHDNSLTFEDNVRLLRDNTVQAHKRHATHENVVLLSGGLDSAVMLIALHESLSKDRVHTLSYRVKGTSEDETRYAQSIANHLNIENRIIEIDPYDKANYSEFEKKVLSMNNPYVGVWIFGNLENPSLKKAFFAGQDTRLHTPDLNPIDKLAFHVFVLRKNALLRAMIALANRIASIAKPLKLAKAGKRYLRGFQRALDTLDTENYMLTYFFKCNKDAIVTNGISLKYYERTKNQFKIDLNKIASKRQLYNEIVRLKWREQYTDDIRYIQDIAKLNKTFIAMPFYDARLASFSSSIPFNQATRLLLGHDRYSEEKVLINKYMLRMAFRDKLNDTIFYRQKAVSSTLHLLFNAELGRKITEIVRKDLECGNSFVRKYDLEKFVETYLKNDRWTVDDEKYLLKVYYISMLCIYNDHVIRA